MTTRTARPAHLKGSRLPDPNRILVGTAQSLCSIDPDVDHEGVTVADADPAVGAEWAPHVRDAMVRMRRFQRLLEEMERAVSESGRSCAHCGGPVPATAGKSIYCRRSCRQRAYEARRAEQ